MKLRRRVGISGKLVCAMLLVGIGPGIVGIAATYFGISTVQREAIGSQFQEIAQQTAQRVRLIVEHQLRELALLAESRSFGAALLAGSPVAGPLEGIVGAQLAAFRERHAPEVRALTVLDTTGRVIATTETTGAEGQRSGPADPWLREVVGPPRGRTFVSAIRVNPRDPTDATVGMAVPIIEDVRERPLVLGALYAKLDARAVFAVAKAVHLGRTGDADLVSDDGQVFACGLRPEETPRPAPVELLSFLGGGAGWGIAKDDGHGGQDAVVGYAPVQCRLPGAAGRCFGGQGWHIVVRQDPAETFGPLRALLWRIAGLGLLAVLALSLGGLYLAHRITQPLGALAAGARRVAEGDLDHRLDVRTGDEIATLADEFNAMAAKLKERQALEAQLRQAERLASVGELAAGVAHEIRNPLSAIVTASDLLRGSEGRPLSPDHLAVLEVIQRESRRLNTLLTTFLNYARPSPPKREKVDVNAVLEEVADALEQKAQLAGGVRILRELDPAIPPALGDPDHIKQVVWNIALNGIQAMPGGGDLLFRSGASHGAVQIEIRDEGEGIPAADLPRIFEPFFTRKLEGTGLGLAIVHRIVEAHGGSVVVAPAPGRGTAFRVRLPADGVGPAWPAS
jgi:signal transduction histidine kinase